VLSYWANYSIKFQVDQLMWSQSTGQTDRQTDGRHTLVSPTRAAIGYTQILNKNIKSK